MLVINKLKIYLLNLKLKANFLLITYNYYSHVKILLNKILPKRLSDTQKQEIIKGFISGKSLNDLSEEFGYSKLTISRNLKKHLGDVLYSKSLEKNSLLKNSKRFDIDSHKNLEDISENEKSNKNLDKENTNESSFDSDLFQSASFTEIVPLDLDIDDENRKELSSVPIDEIDFPKVVFMIVDKKIELEIKVLKDFPEWHFLPEEDLKHKTVQIYSELRDAKRNCKKDQKVIKVPNPNVFKIASKIMISKGITRIVSDNKLISL
tara:strand:+ start:67 stop:858 length:792 start_codon:yes stop_codon:yes gene_type:complete